MSGALTGQAARTAFLYCALSQSLTAAHRLATLRLNNMLGILPRWGELSPPDESLLTQQGGSLIFDGDALTFKHVDSGILRYTDPDQLLEVALRADYTSGSTGLAATQTVDV